MPEPRRSIPAPNQPWPEGDRWGWVCPLDCPSYGTSPSLTATPGVLHPHEAEALADAVMALIDRPADHVPHITLAEEP